MKQLTEGFEALALSWIPSAGNFVSVDLKQDGMPIYEALLQKALLYVLLEFTKCQAFYESASEHMLKIQNF